MKNKTQKIISLVVAIVVGFIAYVNLAVTESMCHYAGDNDRINFIALRNDCYAKYSTGRFWLEIIIVFLVAYLVVFYISKLVGDIRGKKN